MVVHAVVSLFGSERVVVAGLALFVAERVVVAGLALFGSERVVVAGLAFVVAERVVDAFVPAFGAELVVPAVVAERLVSGSFCAERLGPALVRLRAELVGRRHSRKKVRESPMAFVPFLVRAAAFAALASAVTGCVIEDDHHHSRDGYYDTYGPADSQGTTGGATGSSGSNNAATAPMLVEVDTDQTMTADPGQGVGVFVEYGAGGKWHVWWTCDTLQTNKPCDFALTITSGNGPIANLDTSQIQGGYVATPEPARIEASVRTTTEVHGLRFDTLPGAILTIDASVSGLKDGSFLFFVQDGKVRGGFAGQVTNPLQLQGKTP